MSQVDFSQVWYPCSQMKDYEKFTPVAIKKAHGSYLYREDGFEIVDAISSWWCKSLGHSHPALSKALTDQLSKLDHIIMANTAVDVTLDLSKRLCSIMPHINKVMYASDGSCAVEMALKLSLQYRLNTGSKRRRFACLENAYHGETIATMSVSDCGLYSKPFTDAMFESTKLPVVYVSSEADPLWHDCAAHWQDVLTVLEPIKDELTAVIVEPILQGAGGMLVYSQDYLKRLANFCHDNQIHLIADEIMTGFYRTGKQFAFEHAGIKPDMICLGKGLTGGMLPLSAVLTTDEIYDVFYDDYETGKAFMHSHTHSGNALACAVALAALDEYAKPEFTKHLSQLMDYSATQMQALVKQNEHLSHFRHIGMMQAFDLQANQSRAGFQFFQKAIEKGAWLRPLGNSIYWLLPLNSPLEAVNKLHSVCCGLLS